MKSGEFGFIEGIRDSFASLVPTGAEGIGDDCAVMPLSDGRSLLVTTDMLVEKVHFLRESTTPRELGRKALTVNLSDIAAMGGTPCASFLSVSLPGNAVGEWAEEFMAGYREVSERFGVALMGGDTTASPDGIVINVTLLGNAPDANIKRRSGARPGDLLCVAAALGDSAAGLQIVLHGGPTDDDERELVRRHNDPPFDPRDGERLGGLREVTAMMDVSDGIASDILHILRASGVGAAVELSRIPMSDIMRRVCENRGWNSEKLAVAGGEDFVLLFTTRREVGGCTVIGEITSGAPSITWLREGREVEVDYKGYRHF